MNHLKWIEHTSTIMEIQKKLRLDHQSCDVIIFTKEAALQAHRFVLCACSDYFRDIFQDMPVEKEATIIIPDLKSSILECVLTFVYLGEVCVTASQLSDFLESINFLGIKSPISFECHLNKVEQKLTINESISNCENINQNDEEGSSTVCASKEFEYLEVYNEEDKVTHYSIEHLESEANNEYIINENSSHHNAFIINDSKQTDVAIPSTTETRTIVLSDTVEQLSIEKIETEDNSETDKIKKEVYVAQCRNEALEAAIKSVISDGMSLQKAATLYQVSKTVLWRRVKKHPSYKVKGNPLINAAVEKLAQGETLKSVSVALDIPLSTLHRYKMKLFQEGRLPDNIQIRKKDSKENLKLRLDNAVNACQNGMSQNHASTVFGVPKSTLWRHIKKLKPQIKEICSTIIKDDQQLEVDYVSFSS